MFLQAWEPARFEVKQTVELQIEKQSYLVTGIRVDQNKPNEIHYLLQSASPSPLYENKKPSQLQFNFQCQPYFYIFWKYVLKTVQCKNWILLGNVNWSHQPPKSKNNQ